MSRGPDNRRKAQVSRLKHDVYIVPEGGVLPGPECSAGSWLGVSTAPAGGGTGKATGFRRRW
jgi:hypothetical protein